MRQHATAKAKHALRHEFRLCNLRLFLGQNDALLRRPNFTSFPLISQATPFAEEACETAVSLRDHLANFNMSSPNARCVRVGRPPSGGANWRRQSIMNEEKASWIETALT